MSTRAGASADAGTYKDHDAVDFISKLDAAATRSEKEELISSKLYIITRHVMTVGMSLNDAHKCVRVLLPKAPRTTRLSIKCHQMAYGRIASWKSRAIQLARAWMKKNLAQHSTLSAITSFKELRSALITSVRAQWVFEVFRFLGGVSSKKGSMEAKQARLSKGTCISLRRCSKLGRAWLACKCACVVWFCH
jgi:hypothetical protein